MPGNTLNLTLVTGHETTNLNWLLRPAGSPRPILLQPGTQVSLTSSPGQAVLSILNISHKWAGSQPALPLISLLCPPLLSVLPPAPCLPPPPSPLLPALLPSPSFPFSSSHLPILGKQRPGGEQSREWASISAENRRLVFFKMLQWQRAVLERHLLVGKRFTLGFEVPGY